MRQFARRYSVDQACLAESWSDGFSIDFSGHVSRLPSTLLPPWVFFCWRERTASRLVALLLPSLALVPEGKLPSRPTCSRAITVCAPFPPFTVLLGRSMPQLVPSGR